MTQLRMTAPPGPARPDGSDNGGHAASDREAARLACVARLAALEAKPDARMDAVVTAARREFRVETALVSIVDEDRQWFPSRSGIEACETSRDVAFCHYTVQRPEVLVIEDAKRDPRFANNPLVAGPPFIRFYAGAPLLLDGHRVGSFCAMDGSPRRFSIEQRAALQGMAAVVSRLLASHVQACSALRSMSERLA